MSLKAKIHYAIAAMLSVLLVVALSIPISSFSTAAYADDLSDAKAAMDAASAQLNTISQEYNDLQTQVYEYDVQISEMATKVQEAQEAMFSGQATLASTLAASYKSDSSLSLWTIFLSSDDIASFLRNMEYYNSIQQAQADIIAEQKVLKENFLNQLNELDEKKDAQEALLNQAAEKKAQAEEVVAQATAKVVNIESERERIAALQAQAAALEIKKQEEREAELSAEWNTAPGTADTNSATSNNSGSTAPGSNASSGTTNSDSNSSSGGSSSSNDHSQEIVKIDPPAAGAGGWRSGVASAYGGASDKSTPNPGITATGAICDDNSVGVAVPMSWNNYRSFLGKKVEIRYAGKSVIATVNDCGFMGNGSRSLDLQPGVFKAFGYSTCQDWGLRQVEFRFL